MEIKKYKVWMMQEGRTADQIIDIFCIGCGKKLSENADMYCDLYPDYHVFCTKRCSKNINWDIEQEQRERFAVEACKDMGLVE